MTKRLTMKPAPDRSGLENMCRDAVARRQSARKLILLTKRAAEGLMFFGVHIDNMDRDELYGVIGWLTEPGNAGSMLANKRKP